MAIGKKIPRRRQRLYFGLFSLTLIAIAAYITLNALEENIQFFKTPTELQSQPDFARTIRLGGYVKKGSLQKSGVTYKFMVTDFQNEMEVEYSGFIPSLFREEQGVVAIGKMDKESGKFLAEKILAKHDENYMPPEIAEKMGHPK